MATTRDRDSSLFEEVTQMTDLSELNRNVPAKPEPSSPGREKEEVHRRVERESMKAARRAGERENRDEKGNDEFKNIGPV